VQETLEKPLAELDEFWIN